MKIVLPEGCFRGNCYDCRYANWNDTNDDGYPYCEGDYHGYNYPPKRNGCIHFVEK